MKLLDIDTIKKRLDDKFLAIEPLLSGMRLVESTRGDKPITFYERLLGLSFPVDFVELTRRFDFGYLTIGPIAFCNNGDYFDYLIKMNHRDSDAGNAWWDGDSRPTDTIMVAGSDPYSIIFDTRRGFVFAFVDGERFSDSSILVAGSFSSFIRGLGTAILERCANGNNIELAHEISNELCDSDGVKFWEWMTE